MVIYKYIEHYFLYIWLTEKKQIYSMELLKYYFFRTYFDIFIILVFGLLSN